MKRTARVLAAGLIGGVVVTALGLATHHVVEDASFRVYQVDIHGAQRSRPAQLRHLANIPTGAHLATLDLDAIRQGVQRHPWVARATVTRIFPSTVEIDVDEYQPVMLLALDRLWYVDETGHPIKAARSDDLDYPVITGVSQALADQHPKLAAAVTVGALRVLRACDGQPLAADQISEIHHAPNTGFELVLRSGTRLVVGDEDPHPAMARLARLLQHGVDLDEPQRIDLAVETVAVATPLPPLSP
ncbi:MAG: FtsQ-type POTRA domain-containing protein [Oligoflexia bacterium]|nr:FtsQ-type POTRA domain-containing protein [Oligoflexia bacterium]